MAIPNQGLKVCATCGQEKPHSEYYRDTRKNLDGTRRPCFECKVCTKVRVRKWVVSQGPKHLERTNRVAVARRKRRKDLVFSAYGGYVCACCGETEKDFMTIDHINNDGADHRRQMSGLQRKGAGTHTYRWLEKNNFPPGFQVLCMNCQFGKRMCGGVCPHQARRNDHPVTGVESSDSKRIAPQVGEDMILSVAKVTAAGWSEMLKRRVQINELNRKQMLIPTTG